MVTLEPRAGHVDMHYFTKAEGYYYISKFYHEFRDKLPTWYKANPTIPLPEPMRNLLFVPVLESNPFQKCEALRALKKKGMIKHVMFDSGGYQAMTGKENLQGLINRNIGINNYFYDVADILVGLDYPPTGNDDPPTFASKCEQTLRATSYVFERLVPDAQGRYAPVYHPREVSDIDNFTRAYEPILEKSRFATYSAAALTRGVRRITKHIGKIMEAFIKHMEREGIKAHCLGMSSPTAFKQIIDIGFLTCDSVSTVKAAAYGGILFPNRQGSVCCSSHKPEKSITEKELRQLQKQYNHTCPYCEDIDELLNVRQSRMKHNLIVMDELTRLYKDNPFSDNDRDNQMSLFEVV